MPSQKNDNNATGKEEEQKHLPAAHPPDGGWGWVVVIGSFVCQLLADGCAFSFGVIFVELLDYFGESKSKTAWVGSLFVAVPLILGPVSSVLTNWYGCRVMTIVGGIITMCGFVASSFANSIETLCFTFGIVAGIGLSFVYVPAIVIVTVYFEKKRAFATGIAVAGSGIGTFIFAPLIEFLIDVYGWRGAMSILGAVMLNIIVCGALFRPLDPFDGRSRRIHDKDVTVVVNSDPGDSIENGYICPKIKETKTIDEEANENLLNGTTHMAFEKSIHKKRIGATDTKPTLDPANPRISRQDKLCGAANKLVDPAVLQSPSFMYFCLSILFLYLSYDVPYIFTPDKAQRMGISEEKASFLVSIIGITSTFGQVIIGYIGDLKSVNTMMLYIVLTAIAGLFTLLVPWFTTYGWLCTFSACYGFFISANYTLVSVMIVDLLGIEKFTYAYGIEALSEGLANIVGPPFAGWLTDITGSYDAAFIVNGAIMIVSGLMLFAMPCLYTCDPYIQHKPAKCSMYCCHPAASHEEKSLPQLTLTTEHCI